MRQRILEAGRSCYVKEQEAVEKREDSQIQKEYSA